MRRNQPREKERRRQVRRLQKVGQCDRKETVERVQDRGQRPNSAGLTKLLKNFH